MKAEFGSFHKGNVSNFDVQNFCNDKNIQYVGASEKYLAENYNNLKYGENK